MNEFFIYFNIIYVDKMAQHQIYVKNSCKKSLFQNKLGSLCSQFGAKGRLSLKMKKNINQKTGNTMERRLCTLICAMFFAYLLK